MARSKQEPIPNIFNLLNGDEATKIAFCSEIVDLLNLMNASKTTLNLFKPHLDKRVALEAKLCVVQGNVQRLLLIAQHKPQCLFIKGQVSAPRGRTFSNVSAYQLILFLCDKNMRNQLIPLIPAPFMKLRQQQCADLGHGGSDLVKLTKNPLSLDFQKVTHFKTTYRLSDNSPYKLTFPLLENADGIIYYQDESKTVHFYYADRETKQITELEPHCSTVEEKRLFEAFKASFDAMENNSGRRSSDAEHLLITNVLGRKLQRQGIHYEFQGIRYRDSHTSFNLLNAYRKCIRLCDAAKKSQDWTEANTSWCKDVGGAQGEEMWLLQRICEKNLPLDPLPKDFNKFLRDSVFYSVASNQSEAIFSQGELIAGLGSEFALYKGCMGVARQLRDLDNELVVKPFDLIAVFRYVKDAKKNIPQLSQKLEPNLEGRTISHRLAP